MAIIRTIQCSDCGFTLLQGTGTALYVKKKPGLFRKLFGMGERKTVLPDPATVTSPSVQTLVADGSLGNSCACVCLSCNSVVQQDSDSAKKCTSCGSADIESVFEMVGQKCPKCNSGVFEDKRIGRT